MSRAGFHSVSADPDARTFASHMVDAADVNQAILEETLESAKNGRIQESGRTACGSVDDLRHPRVRMPKAVELSTCPVNHMTGFWHTHVTRGQFRSPEHSLPDMANVIFEGAGVSIVTGLETSHIMYAPDDPDGARAAFRDVLGLDVDSTRDVKLAIEAGHVPDPPGARRRVFSRLSGLFARRQTPLVDPAPIEADIQSIPPTMTAPGEDAIAYELVECALDGPVASQTTDGITRIHENAREGAKALERFLRRFASTGFDEAVGVVVGTAVSHYIFGRRAR